VMEFFWGFFNKEEITMEVVILHLQKETAV
jgi:hypothetical protein